MSALWLIPAFIVGLFFGGLVMALAATSRCADCRRGFK